MNSEIFFRWFLILWSNLLSAKLWPGVGDNSFTFLIYWVSLSAELNSTILACFACDRFLLLYDQFARVRVTAKLDCKLNLLQSKNVFRLKKDFLVQRQGIGRLHLWNFTRSRPNPIVGFFPPRCWYNSTPMLSTPIIVCDSLLMNEKSVGSFLEHDKHQEKDFSCSKSSTDSDAFDNYGSDTWTREKQN